MDRTIFVDLSLFVLHYNTNFMNKLEFNVKKKKFKPINNTLIVQIFYNLQNHPTIHTEERLVIPAKGRQFFVDLSI